MKLIILLYENSGWKFHTTFINQRFLMILFTLLFGINYEFAFSQPVSASVTFSSASPGIVNGECNILISDTIGISEVELVLTDRVNDTVLFNYSYTFDQETGLPAGMSWERNGATIILGIGTLPVRPGWTGRVRLKNTMLTWSDPLEFMFQ